ncbi:MAG: transcription termination factor NusA, partial [Alphaproteobacteria bacterium]
GYPLKHNPSQILLAEAQKTNPKAALGEFIMEDLPPIDFGRVAAQAAKQVIFQKVKDVERTKELEEYKDSVGKIINGIVKKSDYNGTTIDLGRAEAFLPREETIMRESFKQGDRVRAYVFKVAPMHRGPQIWVSRTHPNFLIEVYKEVVPEIANGTIQIMGAARDPGFRAKIAVKSYDHNLDPVGACVGVRGVRVQAVTAELQGERIDIIPWSADPATFLVKAMQPATVTKVVLDEEENRIEVVVPQENLSLAIGRRGQNVRLASMLTGWDIDVMSEAEETDRRTKEVGLLTQNFIENLDVDETLARLLISEGFQTVDDLLKVETFELARIDGIDENVAAELQSRAQACLTAAAEKLQKLGVTDELINFPGMNADMLTALGEKGVKSLDDLGDLATDELMEMLPAGMLNAKAAEKMIMAARARWFAAENADNDDEDDAEEAAAPVAEAAKPKAKAKKAANA